MIAWAPRAPRVTIIVVVVGAAKCAEAAPEMAAMKTMASAKTTPVAATEAVTAPATTAADQDQWAAYFTQWRLPLRAAEIARLCECGSGGNSKRKSAKKTGRH